MNAREVLDALKECYENMGNERVRIVSDDYYCDLHDVCDVRVNKNNWTIEIVIR